MDRLRDLVEGANWHLRNAVDAAIDLVSSLLRSLTRPAGLSTVAAIISALAAWLSYETSVRSLRVSEQAAEVAMTAQKFTKELHRQQIEMTQPSLTIAKGLVGRTMEMNRSGTMQPAWGQVEITITNSGARAARPVWVHIQNGSWRSVVILGEVPPNASVDVVFPDSLKGIAKEWAIAIVYGDDVPGKSESSSQSTLVRRCLAPKLLELESTVQYEDQTPTTVRLYPGSPNPAYWTQLGLQSAAGSYLRKCSTS